MIAIAPLLFALAPSPWAPALADDELAVLQLSAADAIQVVEAIAGIPLPPVPLLEPDAPLPPPDEEIRALAAAGKKIEAIKRYREMYGVGLKDAKDIVDRLPRD